MTAAVIGMGKVSADELARLLEWAEGIRVEATMLQAILAGQVTAFVTDDDVGVALPPLDYPERFAQTVRDLEGRP